MMIRDQNFLRGKDKAGHGFFTRLGGVSGGLYASLNCGPGSGDDLTHVAENRRRVCEAMDGADSTLLTLYQVHGNTCVYASAPFAGDRPQADAMVTDVPGIILGILTADCAPVLFYGEKEGGTPVIGAAHAGWGGALKGILQATVRAMTDAGAQTASLRAAVGPCIAQTSYEVREDFALPFLEQGEDNAHFFKQARKAGHLMFDLPGYCALTLAQAGVRHVSISGLDTYSDEERFFSYRRATHRGEQQYGRQISCIRIDE